MTQTAPLGITALTWKYFIIWLVMDCIFVVIVYFFYPETKVCYSPCLHCSVLTLSFLQNKTLEEIAGLFGDKVAESWEETSKYVDGGNKSHLSEKESPNLTEMEPKHIEAIVENRKA